MDGAVAGGRGGGGEERGTQREIEPEERNIAMER